MPQTAARPLSEALFDPRALNDLFFAAFMVMFKTTSDVLKEVLILVMENLY